MTSPPLLADWATLGIAPTQDIDALRSAYRARLKAEYDSEMAELDRQMQREDEAEQRRFESLSPAQQEAERAEIEKNFHDHGIKVLLFARFLPGIRSPIFIMAGR